VPSQPSARACDSPDPPADAVVLQAEDAVGSVVKANLRAAGADLSRIHVYDKTMFGDQPLRLPNDPPLIEDAAREVGAKLVVIDPFTAFTEGKSASTSRFAGRWGPWRRSPSVPISLCSLCDTLTREARQTPSTAVPAVTAAGNRDVSTPNARKRPCLAARLSNNGPRRDGHV